MNDSSGRDFPDAETGERLIDDQQFRELIRARCRPLLELVRGLTAGGVGELALTRLLSGRLLLESSQMEELLDEYGASQNRRWSRLRALVAALRNFARIGRTLAHVQRRLPTYRLLAVDADFHAATGERLCLVGSVVSAVATSLLEEARLLGVAIADIVPTPEDFAEQLPPGRLARNRDDRITTDASITVTYLATEFLNLAAESELLRTSARVPPQDYAHCFPDPVSEERLRQLSFRFHNLQSLYDTHVSRTWVETSDPELSILRGHASVIYHLLKIATDLAHYYERHVSPQTSDGLLCERPVVDTDAIMATLFAYAMAFSSDVLDGGQRLSQNILRRYAEPGRLEVPVPSYRGFHVRPSNLVARIVAHYGSEVQMDLDGKLFDAGSPLDLFRANETINARKRRWLAAEIARVHPDQDGVLEPSAIAAAVLAIVHRLSGEGKVILYRQPLEISDEIGRREGGVLENTVAEIARLQATGQLDIRTDLTVTFIGDKRVLADVDVLARVGYGEDGFGNNVVLPKELSYLRR
ncbi:MAG: hypothetical protein NFW16_17600 [Candidatus Accumulibacter sp.]|uniref:HPr family phosphocarrier protein n=1 Tax=Accumulibacter sp. TaxID=2053492 RepID=UPI00258F14D9|nr:hypothetical protein [Accumulibacter sp.]MCM8623494.1 hypothetical protein [Accumulibacter sp.]